MKEKEGGFNRDTERENKEKERNKQAGERERVK